MSERIPIIAANWKMNKTTEEARAFMEVFLKGFEDKGDKEVVIAPPFTALSTLSPFFSKGGPLHLAAQNMYPEPSGAFTGEISPLMLKELGADWVILGHSERRHIFGESDGLIAKKVDSAVANGMTPILCIGETLEEREGGETFSVLERQLSSALAGLGEDGASAIVIAYEPVWAIGTGRTASADQAEEAHSFVRDWLASRFNNTIAQKTRILYGGSVKPANIQALMAKVEIDGVLVGGASLEPQSFLEIVNYN